MLKDIALKCRSYRRFDQAERIPAETLTDWVDTARIVAASANSQVLRYRIISDEETCAAAFQHVLWAGALTDWDGPVEGERPSAYIVMMADAEAVIADKFTNWDTGIAAQTIMLAATEAGFGGCMIGSFNKKGIAEVTGIDMETCEPVLVLALGKPVEEVHLVEAERGASLKYYRDENMVHYVPKRKIDEVLI